MNNIPKKRKLFSSSSSSSSSSISSFSSSSSSNSSSSKFLNRSKIQISSSNNNNNNSNNGSNLAVSSSSSSSSQSAPSQTEAEILNLIFIINFFPFFFGSDHRLHELESDQIHSYQNLLSRSFAQLLPLLSRISRESLRISFFSIERVAKEDSAILRVISGPRSFREKEFLEISSSRMLASNSETGRSSAAMPLASAKNHQKLLFQNILAGSISNALEHSKKKIQQPNNFSKIFFFTPYFDRVENFAPLKDFFQRFSSSPKNQIFFFEIKSIDPPPNHRLHTNDPSSESEQGDPLRGIIRQFDRISRFASELSHFEDAWKFQSCDSGKYAGADKE